MIIQRFNLNLIPNQSPVIVHVNQYDTGTGRLIATLYEGNEPYSPNGTAVIQGTKPDGHGFQYSATLNGNVVTADLTEQMSPVAGDVRAQIVVTESSGVTGTFVFIMRVQPSALPSDTDMSESDYQYIEEAIREAQEAVQTAQEATETAQEAVERAEAAITETQENAEDSEAWAQGTRGGIPVESTDPTYEHNAEYWAQYAERYAQGGLHYKSSIPFADIPTTGMREGDMYNITDDFTTDSRFEEGAGIEVKGGTNIAWSSDDKWDVLALPPKTTFNGRSGSILPMAGDYDSRKILLSSALHIGGETQNDVQEALEALENNKADRVDNAVEDNFAGLDADGNLKDSGKKASDFATPSDIAGQQSLLKDTVGFTGKNLLKNEATTQTINGVTFTVNDADGSVTASGTASGPSNFFLCSDFKLKAGTYIISAEYSGTTDGNAPILSNTLYNSDGTVKQNDYAVISANGDTKKEFTVSGSDYLTDFRIFAGSGKVVNCTIKPMIRKAYITDPTYEPYHESVEVMYEEEIHGVNLLKNTAVTTTAGNVTFTVNSNGSVTINSNGAISGNQFLVFGYFTLPKGSYILSHGHSIESEVHFSLYISTPDLVVIASQRDDQNEARFTISTDTVCQGVIRAYDGKTINNVTVYPMLRKADIEDSTYRPYNYQAIQNQLNAQGVLGAKNLLQNTATTQTINGVTFTVNADGSVTANGTASSTNNAILNILPFNGEPAMKCLENGKTYIISGLNSGNSAVFLGIQYWKDSTWLRNIMCYDGNDVVFTVPPASEVNRIGIVYQILRNTTVENVICKPMIRLASDPDDTYVPYAMTNRELTEKVFEKRTLTSADDLNNITETGIYSITTAPVNSPEATTYCTLLVKANSSNDIKQIIFEARSAGGYIYIRSYGGNVWGSWYKFTGTVVS